ncbi:MAG: DUF4124 domain-containing protein [Acidithiobacillus sp.]|uniref:DUF4124 domain-containing protein n=1 Tax=Acidithiobacillus sp. TaxID=1872118 RepID=UPI003D05DD4A
MHVSRVLECRERRLPRFALGLCLALTPFLSAQAAIYRWVGPDGVVNYGGSPPANARHVETISGAPEASVSTPAEPATASAPPPARPTPVAPVESAAPPENAAHKQLEMQLAAARVALINATEAYEKGKAVRTGNERNYARYLDKVEHLKENMDAARLRVLLLEHQLETQGKGATPVP